MSIHVRQIIATFSYAQLVRAGVIPDVSAVLLPETFVSKRYPPFVYSSQNYSFFGMFMDYVFRGYLRIYSLVDCGQDSIFPTADSSFITLYQTSRNMNDIVRASDYFTALRFNTASPYEPATLAKYVPTVVNICKSLYEQLQQYHPIIAPPYQFNLEHNCQNVTAHPDVVTSTAILDIKNTTSFSKMSEESILQVLAYFALLRSSCPELQYIGFILPMQRYISLCNITTWDSSRFLQLLLSQAQTLSYYCHPMIPRIIFSPMLGSHIVKGDNLVTTFQEVTYPACQLFLTNPRGASSRRLDTSEVAAARQIVTRKGLAYFTHAPYVINLCKPIINSDNWTLTVLRSDLENTRALGGRGVVVHTGQYTTQDYNTAMNNMELQIRQVLPYATSDCRLLLETPCGEGTEVCTTVIELAEFFKRFSAKEQEVMGLCVDTCHVFAAGYDPLEYMQQWMDICSIPIALVHYNDSKDEFGSRKDHHMIPGMGYIGSERMTAVLQYCVEKMIPMVRE